MKTTQIVLAIASLLMMSACKEPNAPLVAEPAPAPAVAPVATQRVDEDVLAELDAETVGGAVTCNLESSNNVLFSSGALQAASGDTLRGWLGHDASGVPEVPRLLFRSVDGASVAVTDIVLSHERDDVVSSNGGREELRNSGFEAAIPTLAPGTYAMVLRYRVNGHPYACDNGRAIRID